jgi:hypothetical protein
VTAPLLRSPLTTLVLTTLREVGIDIGDGELPDASWIGQPNLPGSTYEPFAVLSELTADHAEGPFAASQGDWRMPYMVECFGIRREQVSWTADKLRGGLNQLRFSKLLLGTDSYKIQYVRTDSFGAPTQINVTYPVFWHQQDSTTLYLTKEIAPA